jgi:hypothetical protein
MSLTTGSQNAAVGKLAMRNTSTGNNNAALGQEAMRLNSSGGNNVAIGFESLYNNTSASNNTAIGYQAGYNNTTGTYMTAVGHLALYKMGTTNRNTGIGNEAGRWVEGYYNTYVGAEAGKGANGTNTASSNVAVGTQALQSVTSGNNNVAIGAWTGGTPAAMAVNTTGNKNIGIGSGALGTNTTGAVLTAVGYQALYSNTTASDNEAFGYRAMYSSTTGTFNTAIGGQSLYDNTTGDQNVAVGYLALTNNTTSNQNTAIGSYALHNQTTATTGQNVALGHKAGYTTNSYYNTFLGYKAGEISTGYRNTFVGHGSGISMTTGQKNTILGNYSGNSGGLDIRESDNNIVLADGDGVWRFHANTNTNYYHNTSHRWEMDGGTGATERVVRYSSFSSGGSGYFAPGNDANSDNKLYLGVSDGRWIQVYATNTSISTSDRREKQDIEELSEAERRVAVACKGLLRKYRWIEKVQEEGDDARIHFGIIAQDLQAAFEAEGLDANRYSMFCNSSVDENDSDRLMVRYSELLAFIIAAI